MTALNVQSVIPVQTNKHAIQHLLQDEQLPEDLRSISSLYFTSLDPKQGTKDIVAT